MSSTERPMTSVLVLVGGNVTKRVGTLVMKGKRKSLKLLLATITFYHYFLKRVQKSFGLVTKKRRILSQL